MKVSDLFKDKTLLCKEMLWDAAVDVEIESVKADVPVPKAGSSKTEPCYVMYFKGKTLGLVLNITNRKFLISALGGKRTEEWVGKTITLYVGNKGRKNPDKTHGGICIAHGDRYSGDVAPQRATGKEAAE